jgi:hypothetical protein
MTAEKSVRSNDVKTSLIEVTSSDKQPPAFVGNPQLNQPLATLISALQELLSAERAGAEVAAYSLRQRLSLAQHQLMKQIQQGEADSCRRLRICLERLGQVPNHQTGAFYEKAIAIEKIDERLAFIDRGQRWVIKRIRESLPFCDDPAIKHDLSVILTTHELNSEATSKIL